MGQSIVMCGGDRERIVYLVIFVILFVVIHRALKELPFNEASRAVLAACVALLSVIGLGQTFSGGALESAAEPNRTSETGIYVLLIPYVAMALAILIAGLLMVILKLFPRFGKNAYRRERVFRPDREREAAAVHQPRRPAEIVRTTQSESRRPRPASPMTLRPLRGPYEDRMVLRPDESSKNADAVNQEIGLREVVAENAELKE